MRTEPEMRRVAGRLLVAGAAVLAGSCSDSTGPGSSTPPDLPPVASMQVDVSFFQQAGEPAASGAVGLNWTAAAIRVGVANLAVSLTLAVPVATWAAAATQTPTVEEGKWHWRYSVQHGGGSYGAHVTGFLDGNESVWQMRVTNSVLGLDEFLWFDGRAVLNGTSGHWSFRGPTTGGAEVGRIDWTHPSADAWTLTFTDTNAGSAGVGDRLEYEASGSARLVSHVDASSGQTIEIGWDAVTKAGWIIAPGHNGGLKACWNGALNDVACS